MTIEDKIKGALGEQLFQIIIMQNKIEELQAQITSLSKTNNEAARVPHGGNGAEQVNNV